MRSYRSRAGALGAGVATSGVVTFAYFAVASHVLDDVAYKRVALLWSVLFVVVTVIYRPVEQLLSRSIAERGSAPPLRVPLAIQGGFALAFLVAILALRGPIENGVFDGSGALYAVLVAAVLAYAASYFARGWLAGHGRFGLYGTLVALESISRFCFALAAAVGLTHGQGPVALGMAAAPVFSLLVVPWAIARADRPDGEVEPLRLRGGAAFAVAVLLVQLAEQTLLNVGVIVVDATASNAALAGFVFNVLIIVRAPLVLFQAVQTTLLPHLAGGGDAGRAVRAGAGFVAAFAGSAALGLLAIGPRFMHAVFGPGGPYTRAGLAVVAVGMGFHLMGGILTQVALARGRAAQAAGAWLLCAALFVVWVASPAMPDELLRAELGYLGAAGLLAGLLFGLYRRSPAPPPPDPAPGTPPSPRRNGSLPPARTVPR